LLNSEYNGMIIGRRQVKARKKHSWMCFYSVLAPIKVHEPL